VYVCRCHFHPSVVIYYYLVYILASPRSCDYIYNSLLVWMDVGMTPVPLCIFFPLSPRPVARSGAYDRSTNETGEVVVRAGIATLNTRGGSGLFVPFPCDGLCGVPVVSTPSVPFCRDARQRLLRRFACVLVLPVTEPNGGVTPRPNRLDSSSHQARGVTYPASIFHLQINPGEQ
jgi:hypothetical protein